jgi:hypothetical protein
VISQKTELLYIIHKITYTQAYASRGRIDAGNSGVDGKTSLTSGLRNGVKALHACGGGMKFMQKIDEKPHNLSQISHIQL